MSKKREAFIVDGLRTPIGKFSGGLSHVRADDLAALPIQALLARHPTIPKNAIDDVLLGCANQAGEDNRNIARTALLLAGLPETVPGETINRLCGSGLSTIVHAGHSIQANEGDIFITGGTEHMTRAPFVMGKLEKAFGRNASFYDTTMGWRFINPRFKELYGVDEMGQTAENLISERGISREDQDRFAYSSQMKASKARSSGRLAKEIIPVEVKTKKESFVVSEDEFIRPSTNLETLAKLPTPFSKGGTVTAGNASGINDGACAVLVASEEALKKYSLSPKARILSSAVAGVPPRIMGIGPVPATKLALSRAGLSLDEMDIIELNEAFAGQSLAVTRELGLQDDDARLNPNGGAISLGHPLGMSGARLALSASIELHEQSKRYALITMCIGVGQGIAAVIERV